MVDQESEEQDGSKDMGNDACIVLRTERDSEQSIERESRGLQRGG